jgi:hypothetical protein
MLWQCILSQNNSTAEEDNAFFLHFTVKVSKWFRRLGDFDA